MTGLAALRGLVHLAGVLSIATLVALALAMPGAQAGEFGFSQCGASGGDLDGRYSRLGNVDRVDVRTGCRPGSPDSLGVFQDRRGGSFSEAEGGQYLWRAPAGLAVVGVTLRSKLKDANGLRAAIAGRVDGAEVDLDGGLPHDGSVVEVSWTNRLRPLDSVVVRLRCNRDEGCPNRPESAKAFFEVLGIELQVLDSRPPSIDGSGGLLAPTSETRWLNGRVDYSLTASDLGSGLAELSLKVNGFSVPLEQPTCSGVSASRVLGFSPCPSGASRSGLLDTAIAPFQEGANGVELCVSDYAAPGRRPNATCTGRELVMVDNREPPPPVDLRTDRDGSWSALPEVGVSWDSIGDPGSGIASVRWRLVGSATGNAVAAGSVAGVARSITIRVPEAGDYFLEIRFADHAGNVGSPAVARVRFDDIPPPPASPVVPVGWLSRDELPLPARVDPVEAAGPSGILGYALAASDEGPLAPCRASTCDPAELTLIDRPGTARPAVGGLREGVNWLSAVAVSGASVPSRSPVTSRVLVDRSYPDTALSGGPSGWSRGPVTLTARATDSLSGMTSEPDDDGRPVTVIEAEDGEVVASEGGRAEMTLTGEGIVEVRFFARDLAGNVNDGRLAPNGERHAPPGVELVKIDRTAPSLSYGGRPDPARPEVVRFELDDRLSGVAAARVLLSPAGRSGGEVELASRLVGGGLEAEVPSDDLPPGQYSVLARASDRAGNHGSSDPVVLTLPLKSPVAISVREKTPSERSISGVVRLAGAEPGRAMDLVVEEEFDRTSGWETRQREVRSTPDGRFEVELPPGPRRTVRVLFLGTATESRAASRPVGIVNRDRVTLSASARVLNNGEVLTMEGRVSGAGFGPAMAGKSVVVQYFDPSRRRWRPVEVLACGPGGRFRLAYRFTTITSPQRILFRASSIGEAAWPFRPSASRRIAVVVWP